MKTSQCMLAVVLLGVALSSCKNTPAAKKLTDTVNPPQAGLVISRDAQMCSIGIFAKFNSKIGILSALHCTDLANRASTGETFSQSLDGYSTFATVKRKGSFRTPCNTATYCINHDVLFAETKDQSAKNAAVANVPVGANTPVNAVTDQYTNTHTVLLGDAVTTIGAISGKHTGSIISTYRIAKPTLSNGDTLEIDNLRCSNSTGVIGGDSGGPVMKQASPNRWLMAGITSTSTITGTQSCFTAVTDAMTDLNATVAY